MLARFRMVRGPRPVDEPLPPGIRQDTRKHTRHCLRPTSRLVSLYLYNPTEENWQAFETAYLSLLEERYADDRGPFDALAEAARTEDVYLGCSCPTRRNPDVNHCHTVLALRFMQTKYPTLPIEFPSP